MSGGRLCGDHVLMPTFLIEVHVGNANDAELERALGMLNAAQARMLEPGLAPPIATAGITRDDGRLICLIQAPSRDVAQRLVSVALPPGAKIREITHLAGRQLLGGHPSRDVDPGIESEFVEDVVDVGLDSSLGQE